MGWSIVLSKRREECAACLEIELSNAKTQPYAEESQLRLSKGQEISSAELRTYTKRHTEATHVRRAITKTPTTEQLS